MIFRAVPTIALALCAAAFATPARAADDFQTGWAAWFNTKRLDDRWNLVSDVQVRTTDDWERTRSFIGRVGVTYAWRPRIALGGGYAYNETLNVGAQNVVEHRLWQQAIVQQSIGRNPLAHRVRLEQRFIDRAGDDFSSIRVRYSARLQVPLAAPASGPFVRGNYVALQNELFLNLTGRDEQSGKLVDQNRAYVGVGRRFTQRIDLELGYINQFVPGRSRDTLNHVVQLAVYTRH